MSSSPVDYSSKCVMFPARPGYGIVGRKCLIKANHFTLQLVTTIHNYKGLYHYHVWISPQVTSMKLNRDIVKELGTLNYLGNVRVAYDGRNTIYSVGELPFSSNEFILKFPTTKTTTTTSECEFKVSIRYSVVGRSFYHDTMSRAGELGDGVMYWKGFYQSLRPTQLGLSLNIDVSAKAFYEPIEVTDFIFKNFNVRYDSTPLDDHVRVQLRKNLRGVKVTCRHLDDTMLFKVFLGYRQNNYNDQNLVRDFGINVANDMTLINARVLPPPLLLYHDTGNEATANPQLGQWNMINKAFQTAPVIPSRAWPANEIEEALKYVHDQCNMILGNKQLQLLIVILPDFSGSYGTIKRVCETELGIVSQCCRPKHAAKLNNKQYLENLSLKINTKVGGRNTVLSDALNKRIPFVSDVPTIIFGAAFTHPKPEDYSSPSIAAVVASMDWPEVTKYRALVSAQQHTEEIIQDLYKVTTDDKGSIVHGGMIRDGVSDGQFNRVLLYEMDAIRKACSSLEEGYLPRVTFVAIQKRCHTRLFPADYNDCNSMDKSGNILPGTVVDTHICHPTQFDFYLKSHAGIQGTSRPAHYHVLFDENNFTADALQVLTNNLCYTYDIFIFFRSSVSSFVVHLIYSFLFSLISYDLLCAVPPAYYAHLAAIRARCYIGVAVDEEETDVGPRTYQPLQVINGNLKDVMFYV
ncbi:hypothetical protein CsatA_017845 [Cannabis sativa]